MKEFQKDKFDWFINGRIYHLLIDRFTGHKKEYSFEELQKGFLFGNIRSLLSKLDYIQSMNFNIIWLSPFFVNQPNGYHGYHVINYNHIDPRFIYGEYLEDKEIGNPLEETDLNYFTKSDKIFKEFLEECHKRKIKVMMDLVLNHVHKNHPFFIEAYQNNSQKYFNWFYIKDGNYLKFLEVEELPKLNLDFKECGDYLIKVTLKYLNMGIDAIRLDHAIGPSKNYLKRFINEIHFKFPNVPIIGENLPLNLEKYKDTILGMDSEYLKKLTKINIDSIPYLDQSYIEYENILDGLIDFSFLYIVDSFAKGEINLNKCEYLIEEHYKRFLNKKIFLLKVIDSHDSDRILFRCNNDRKKFKQCLELLYKNYNTRNDPLIFYYGTEDFMSQNSSIEGEPYGDYKCRMPMNFDIQWIKIFFKNKND